MKKFAIALSALASAVFPAASAITLPSIVSPHMVLQQQSDARLWGWATPGAEISVHPQWLGEAVVAIADSTGRWDVTVSTPEASMTPYTIGFRGDGSEITVDDVLIGEVWFCSGQSNMEMTFSGYTNQPIDGADQAIASTLQYPHIRMARVHKRLSEEPQDSARAPWRKVSPQNVRTMSALCYFFARELTDMLHVPVGIIDCSYDGTRIEGWLSADRLNTYPEIDLEAERTDGRPDQWHRSNLLYNGMLYPVRGYNVKGFLWYQGYSNIGEHELYASRQHDFVTDLRKEWADTTLPFIFVEMPPLHCQHPDSIEAALFREAQLHAEDITPRTRMVGTSDIAYPHEVHVIHGSRKGDIARRMAWMAADLAYGIEGLPTDYPRFDSIAIEPDRAVITLVNAPNGLTPHFDMPGFEVAGTDGVFRPAKAHVDWITRAIIVELPAGTDRIESVRYNFRNFNTESVHNLIGLPLTPFRTDK